MARMESKNARRELSVIWREVDTAWLGMRFVHEYDMFSTRVSYEKVSN